MPAKKTSKKKKVTPNISIINPPKRFTHWLCSPGNVCLPVEEPSFTDNFNWRIFRIMAEFIDGFEFLSKLKNEVSIFGSARCTSDDPHYKTARALGHLLGKKGYTVITGGGPGIMEAANWGAFEAGAPSVGLDIELPMEQRRNQFATRAMGFHHFFVRKVMLSASSQAYIFFPGGFGTIDEMTEMITLIQTQKIPRDVPVILIGSTFWKPFIDWSRQVLHDQHRYVSKDDLAIMHLVDTPEEAFEIIKKTVERKFG